MGQTLVLEDRLGATSWQGSLEANDGASELRTLTDMERDYIRTVCERCN